jgi:hypothetical protein
MNQQRSTDITFSLLTIQNQIKVYHWQTRSYARHIASDNLFLDITKKIDKFIEVMQGSWNIRINVSHQTIPLFNLNDQEADTILSIFRNWLLDDLPLLLENNNPELLNIRDEILASVNRAMYLFSLD